MMTICVNSTCDALARFMAHGGGGCDPNTFYPKMTTVEVCTDVHGNVDGCGTVSVDTSLKDGKVFMYGVSDRALESSHR